MNNPIKCPQKFLIKVLYSQVVGQVTGKENVKKKKIKSHNFSVWGGILHVITLTGLAAGACPLVFMPAGLSCLFEDHFHAALDGGELHILSTRE